MIWNKITIDTTTEAADIVASVLFDNNIVGAEIEDNQNLSDEDLSSKTKRLAYIYFDFKNIEKSLYSWLKETQSKIGYQFNMVKGIYI